MACGSWAEVTGMAGKKKLRKCRERERPPCPPQRCRSQRGHVIESMVKLLADRFVLQLLGVQLVYRSRGQKVQQEMQKNSPEEEARSRRREESQKAAAKAVEENRRETDA